MRPLPAILLAAAVLGGSLASQTVDVYSRPRQPERSSDYDALHYRIKLRFDEGARSFEGQTRITLRPLRDGFNVCVLDAETFEVLRVVDDVGAALEFEQTPGKLTVRLARPYAYHEELSFTVFYRAGNVSVDPEKYGMGAGYDLGISFHSETAKHPPLIQALSFPEGARHWFPCFDHPRDKATSEVIATVRAEYRALSNGELVSVTEDRERGERTFHWHEKLPHSTYLYGLTAGPYVKLNDSLGTLPLAYWVYPKDVGNARRSFWKTPEIIEFFNREYGYRFPWVKYDQITIPGIGGGAESTNATLLGQSTIHDEKAEPDFPSHPLVAHEAAHQWWGDLVTMRDWSETWMNEGFATYGEYLYSRHSKGPDEGALNLWQKKNSYLKEARERYIRPIVFDRWEYPNQNFDRHTYQKGAAVLHMLRWVMGDAQFRRAMRHFLEKHAFQSVDTRDLAVAIRESTGQVLDWFFEQWVYKAGHPVFEVGYEWLPAEKKVRLTVEQVQEVTEWVPVFRMPVVIRITTKSGKREEKVWLRKRKEVINLDCPRKPLLVRFDEGNYLLKEWTFKKSNEELRYQLRNDDVIGRMWAASELGKRHSDPENEEALRSAAREDPFWAVRREAVLAGHYSQVPEQIRFFEECGDDQHSAVRAAALKVMGDRKLCGRPQHFEHRFLREESYVAQPKRFGRWASVESRRRFLC